MYEWNYAVQEMIDWIEANISTKPTLEDLAKQVGQIQNDSFLNCVKQEQKTPYFAVLLAKYGVLLTIKRTT